jgi:protein SCO1/2
VADTSKPSIAQWLIALGVALALSGAFLAWRHRPTPAPALPPSGQLSSSTLVDDAMPLPTFELRRANGTLTNADLVGHWTLLDFGYTFCPDICPTTLATLKEVKTQLEVKGTTAPQVIFVSVDAARDSAERLTTFVQFFDPAFVGATGDDAALAPLAKHLGVQYERHDAQDKKLYVVDHSAVVYLIDPQGKLKATFSWPHDPATMATDYAQITSGRRASL